MRGLVVLAGVPLSPTVATPCSGDASATFSGSMRNARILAQLAPIRAPSCALLTPQAPTTMGMRLAFVHVKRMDARTGASDTSDRQPRRRPSMKRMTSAIATATVLMVAPSLTAAQTTHYYDFQGGSGVSFNGVQVGTYKGALDGGATINTWCTDFYNYAGDAWVYKTNLETDPLSKTRWGGLTNQPSRYKMAGYLTSLFQAGNHGDWGYIHYAIWQLINSNPLALNPKAGLTAAQQSQIDGYKAMALSNFGKYSYQNMSVLTDQRVTTSSGCPNIQGRRSCGIQEQLIGNITLIPPTVVTPEPATIGRLATGLVSLSLAGFRRRRKQ